MYLYFNNPDYEWGFQLCGELVILQEASNIGPAGTLLSLYVFGPDKVTVRTLHNLLVFFGPGPDVGGHPGI